MPDGNRSREAIEDPLAICLNGEETSFALRPLITFPRMQAFHQIHLGSIDKRDLLVASTNPEYRLPGIPDDFKNTSQRFRCVLIPWVALATKNNVRRLQRRDPLHRRRVKRLGQYLAISPDPPEGGPYFSRARALSINGVVDEVNEHALQR